MQFLSWLGDPGSKRGRAAPFLTIAVAAAITAAITVLASALAAPADNSPPATTTGTGTADKMQGVAARGRLEPQGGIIRLGAPSTPDAVSGGAVAKLHVDFGDDVTAGQLLAEIDTGAVVTARLAEAKADHETARREALATASLADESCVLAEVASRQARRKTELLGRGLASSEETELAKGDADAGAASCAARRAVARVSESAIASAQARVARYQAELERSFIRAPFAGRVLDVHARPGEIVGLDGVLELGRVGSMYAIAEVYETDVRNLRSGMRARVTSNALAGDLSGTVERIRPKVQKMDEIGTDPAARKDARIVEVEIRLDDSKAAANLTNLQVDIEIGR
jgi:HlyD family secretion protein